MHDKFRSIESALFGNHQDYDSLFGLRYPWPHDVEVLLVTIPEARRLLRVGRTKIFELLRDGTLERRKIGGSTRITLRSVLHLAGYY